MSESIKQRMGALSVLRDATPLRKLFEAIKTELDALRTLTAELLADHASTKTLTDELKVEFNDSVDDIAALRAAIVGITAKLDADAGITDTNYAATWDPAAQSSTAISSSGPATLAASAATETLVD